MKRRRKRRNKQAKPKTKTPPLVKHKQQDSELPIKMWSKQAWTLIGSIGIIVGLIASLLVFASRLSISSSTPLDPSDPFSASFFISNDGLFAIHNVKAHCYLGDIKFSEGGSVSKLSVADDSPPISAVEASEKTTIRCKLSRPFANPNDRADIAVVVSYRPSFFPYYKMKVFRFSMKQGSDKQWHWFPEPLAKEPII